MAQPPPWLLQRHTRCVRRPERARRPTPGPAPSASASRYRRVVPALLGLNGVHLASTIQLRPAVAGSTVTGQRRASPSPG